MAKFNRRTWKDRVVEYANRYKMTDVDTGEVTNVNLNRLPGTVTEAGDTVSAASLNDLEDRIEASLNAINDDVQQYVISAAASAESAASSAAVASDAIAQAQSSASSAALSQAIAKSSADVAQNESANAGKSAENAESSALEAKQAADRAAASADDIGDAANLAQSYAVGGTGARDGEDTDNSKYYSEQAKLAAEQAAATHDGVASWNGRGGNVVPASGDYTASMITTKDGSTVEEKLAASSTVDQTYDATSANAQSGTAVAEALKTVDLTSVESEITNLKESKADASTVTALASRVTDNETDISGSVKSIAINGQTVTVTWNNSTTSTYTTQDTVYTLPAATSSVLGGVTIGDNITVSDGKISVTKSNVTGALGYTPPTTNTTYSNATTSVAGLMSASDKSKLDGIASGANAYTLPTATSSVLGGVKTGSNITNSSGTISLTKANVTSALGYTPPTTNTTYGVATSSANGLMSSTDKAHHDAMYTEVYARPNTRKLSTQTLTAEGGTLTWTDSCITDDSLIDVYASIPNVAPSAITQSGTTVTVTFDAQDAAFDVAIVVM